jgi:8-oxo-dGTP pyrophosphatase MutT (NUDIX family)
MSQGMETGIAGEGIDWRARVRAVLAGSQPRHAAEDWLLPGLTAAESQQYRPYFPTAPRPAAVLIPLVEREPESTVLLTQRATQLRNHAGQISFPGGAIEPSDAGPAAAALREAREEVGLDERFVQIIGYLPDHVLLSGFRVTPVVGLVRPGFELLLQPQEVHDTFEVPLSFIFDPGNHRLRRRRFGGGEAEVELYDIPFGDRNIWGATAGMLLTLYRMSAGAS